MRTERMTDSIHSPSSLAAHLDHTPRPLRFGTSGRRGAVVDLTQLEVYINALAELEYLQSLPREAGGIAPGDDFFIASDLRPSSCAYVPEQQGRGELTQAIVEAVRAAGMHPAYLGRIPTPALTAYALAQSRGSIMVTGSHIPFNRNGYKTNTARGELLKCHEQPIDECVAKVRARLYSEAYPRSLFDAQGRFKAGHCDLPAVDPAAEQAYRRRYADFFGGTTLAGLRLLAYQHSAVGRDLLPTILRELGAEVITTGRSEQFVPIDTENIDAGQLARMQVMVDDAVARHGPLDALVSTDGDSDRPLILGLEADGAVRFFGGDLVGMITAEFLGADAVVVPISCNDAIDRGGLKAIVEPKTRIGSPFVIAGMEAARMRGKQVVCGWEANGGFLTGTDILRNGNTLKALPTRDAVLPIVAVLAAARQRGLSLVELFSRLPARFGRAALIREFPGAKSREMIRRHSPPDPAILEVEFTSDEIRVMARTGVMNSLSLAETEVLRDLRTALSRYFQPADGFGDLARINYLDGIRLCFSNGDVAHLRPSGNADELRLYAVADTQERANAIAFKAVAEPDGILRQLEKAVAIPETA